jgi:hypothetical protein
MVKTETIYPKNVGAQLAMDFIIIIGTHGNWKNLNLGSQFGPILKQMGWIGTAV